MSWMTVASWIARIIALGLVILFIFPSNVAAGIFLSVLILGSCYIVIRKHTTLVGLLDLLFFIFLLVHIGGLLGWYAYSLFDDILHFFAGMLLGVALYYWLFRLHHSKRIKLTPLLLSLFTFSLALSVGVFWEFFEFLWDTFIASVLETPLAQADVADNMNDLFWDLIGSIVAVGLLTWGSRYKWVRRLLTK